MSKRVRPDEPLPRQVKLVKINNEKIVPVKVKAEPQNYPGKHISPSTRYPNINPCGAKGSGKTSAVTHMVDRFVDEHSHVIIFCPTVNTDPRWIALTRRLKEKGVDLQKYTAIVEVETDKATGQKTKINRLKELIDMLIEEYGEEEKDEKEDETDEKDEAFLTNYVIVFGDMAEDMHIPAVGQLNRRNRHFHAVVIEESHEFKDLNPASRRNQDIGLYYYGHPEEQMLQIYRQMCVRIPFPEFYGYYKSVTRRDENAPESERHNFLYVNKFTGELRKNFDFKIPVSVK